MSIKYPLPAYAASIWTNGTHICVSFPNDQTIIIPLEQCGVETSEWGAPLPSQRGWSLLSQLLRDRAAQAQDETRIGHRGQPTQYEVERALALDAKYASILGAMAQAKTESKQMRITILHMQLMMHYHAVAEPYAVRNPAHANSLATQEYRQQLIDNGMLCEDNSWESGYRTTDRGEAYIQALKAVQP